MLLRQLNPGLPIHGIYGGPEGYRRAAFKLAGRRLSHLDTLWFSSRPPRWNWLHGDIALAEWFRDVGHAIDFDGVYVIQWDLLVLESLDRIFASVPTQAVGLTALTPLTQVEGGWKWIDEPKLRRQWDCLLDEVRRKWGYDDEPLACWGPGQYLPRPFLERYAATDLPEYGHDELRLPLLAQAFGFPLADNGLRHRWHDTDEDRFFNMTSTEITLADIHAQCRDPHGRRAFHPVYRRISLDEVCMSDST